MSDLIWHGTKGRPLATSSVGRPKKAIAPIAKRWTCNKFSIQSLDKGGFTGAVLLDLSKAFEAVDHVLLDEKLKIMVASSQVVKWFASYLESRYQVTCVENYQSPQQKVLVGVPQEGVLGPLFFLIYTLATFPAV